MSWTRTVLAVTVVAAATALAGCDGQSTSPDTSAAATQSRNPATSVPGSGTPTPQRSSPDSSAPTPGTDTGGSTTNGGDTSGSGASRPGNSPSSTKSGPSMTLKVVGTAKLKVTKITTKGALTSTVPAPATLTVSIDPTVKIGYTITAVALSGKITSCIATTPDGTKHVPPRSGACSTTYTPGG